MKPKRGANSIFPWILLIVGLGSVCTLGCQSLPNSGLDPYGERLFERSPLSDCKLFPHKRQDTTPTQPPVSDSALGSLGGASVYQPPGGTSTASTLPGNLGGATSSTAVPNVPVYGTTATILGNAPRGINTAIVQNPQNETKRAFEETGGYALPTQPVEGPAILMTPREQIAPVGSEVVLVASYLGNGDRLITNEKIEWNLEGAGTIEQFDKGSCCDPLRFDFTQAKKITDRYAITKTSQLFQTIDRGTVDTKDDLHLLRGQTWISVNSMKEGTTHVTAFAPALGDWSRRTDAGIIHWVDTQWVLPRMSIAPVGESRVLTTTVLRQTNGQPRKGWIVRYEILNGPAAGLGSSGYQVEEVETDISGQASVMLIPRENITGTNTIAVRIIRPSGVDGADRRVTVGSETIRQTWSGSSGIRPVITGPEMVRRGQDIPYTISLNNTTGTASRGVLMMEIPVLATYVNSTPLAQRQGNALLWNIEVLPQATTTFQVVLQAGNNVGDIFPKAWFYPQGTQPVLPSHVTGVGVSPVPDPASVPPTIPTTPSTGATTFPNGGNTGNAGSTTPNTGASNTGAAVYVPTPATASGIKANLRLNPKNHIQVGQAFDFFFTVENTGASEIRNVKMQISVPPEFANQQLRAASDPGKPIEPIHFNKENIVVLNIPVLAPRQIATLNLEYPTIQRQGYQIVGEVFVDNVLKEKTLPLTVTP
jgi:hypothetical protein